MHQPLPPARPIGLASLPVALALNLAAAVMTRLPAFGNPVIHVDEQFYLLVGEHMLRGEWPYSDIFDRKPFLLFALNAGFALFGSQALWAQQIAALLAVVATALLLRAIARRALPDRLTAWPGVLYIALLPGFEGIGAQAPVFYTPLVCLAALWTLRAAETGHLLRYGALAMLASGLAIQIKYSVIFECGLFGLALLWRAHRSHWPAAQIVLAAAVWIGTALLPSAAIGAGYAAAGHWDAFWQANVMSNLAVGAPLAEALPRLAVNLAILIGVLACAAAGWSRLDWSRGQGAVFVRWWCAAALFGYVVYGTWYTHYMLPVLAPLSLAAIAGFAAASRLPRRAALGLLALTLVACGVRGAYLLREHGTAAQAERIAATIRERIPAGERLLIYAGDPGFYRLAGSPLPHPFVFPDHYSRNSARRFLPQSPTAALRATFAHPPAVVMRVDKLYPDRDREADAWLADRLARDYQPYARLPIGSKHVLLYARR